MKVGGGGRGACYMPEITRLRPINDGRVSDAQRVPEDKPVVRFMKGEELKKLNCLQLLCWVLERNRPGG